MFFHKRAIMEVLRKRRGEQMTIIDVGAGKGELLSLIAREMPECSMFGVDYLPCPDGFPLERWLRCDLNDPPSLEISANIVICSEVIEHLENPRKTTRFLASILAPGGTLILTTPNQHSIRSILSLLIYGHFVSFRDSCYPAHITALLRKDAERIFRESGLKLLTTNYTNDGRIPGMPHVTWQKLSLNCLRGRLFSDNILFVAQN